MGEKIHARYWRLLLLGHLFCIILAESTSKSENKDRSAFMRQLLYGRQSSAPARQRQELVCTVTDTSLLRGFKLSRAEICSAIHEASLDEPRVELHKVFHLDSYNLAAEPYRKAIVWLACFFCMMPSSTAASCCDSPDASIVI